MDGDIRVDASLVRETEAVPAKIMVPMQVGSATVYVVQREAGAIAAEDDAIRPVAPLSPSQVFESAGEILRECVRVVGESFENLAETARPQQVSVEFSLSFEVKGKASIVPVFVTGESSAQSGLKVTAVWTRAARAGS